MDALTRLRIKEFTDPKRRLGASCMPGEGVHVRIWAPKAERVEIEWIGDDGAQKPMPLQAQPHGYFAGLFPGAAAGDRYYFHLDGQRIADPASRFQPEGVFGPSEVVSPDFDWRDDGWAGVPFSQWVIYEIHPGTYSPDHGFAGIIDDLPRLKALGVTVLEIMPVSQFSGARNWGYDGVFPHAVQDSYGGPAGLKALVDAAHAHGLAVILDVVYNHIGPEGNVLFSCGRYVHDKYHTPWGDALNFDGRESEEVRRYFLQSVWQWLTEYHFDGLRLDAVQTIFDTSPMPFLEELARLKRAVADEQGREIVVIAETDMNDPRMLGDVDRHGMGMDAHWGDDLHHALHATLTGERDGYYADYDGGVAQIAKIYRDDVAYDGQYSAYRKRRHGRPYDGIDRGRLVAQTQNHDQVGNRLFGERLSVLVDFERLKLAAACVLLSPFTPLLFMGEEWACEQPFLYFVSHHDPKLIEAVRKGRKAEWESFDWAHEPPDPAADDTFERCVLVSHIPDADSRGAVMVEYYKALIALSKDIRGYLAAVEYDEAADHIVLRYEVQGRTIMAVLSFNADKTTLPLPLDGEWRCTLQSTRFVPGTRSDGFDIDGEVSLPPFSATVLEGRTL